ncbi:MAG: hypothetical protein A2Y76_10265 [Planctomycetes bacterium RBG_13_60_9]|nr:MAG: hypothetical protein A2Y76_10265 [Planctomycetes bacterium RBG_13_60_9]
MQRREFLATSCAAGLASLAGGAALAGEAPAAARLPGETEAAYRARLARIRAAQAAERVGPREYYELRRYEIETPEQKTRFDKFAAEALVPALNRHGVETVGVFYPEKDPSPIYVLLVHKSLQTCAALTEELWEDQEFLTAGAEVVDAPASSPVYKRIDVELMVAFAGMPRPERPVTDEGRVLQLRTYESPSEKTGFKKIEMFNSAEIAIFRKVGLHPVFFGRTIAGPKMPNLTYMLAFKDAQEREANWKKFREDPDWQALHAKPEYADKKILRDNGITDILLKPASYSQI